MCNLYIIENGCKWRTLSKEYGKEIRKPVSHTFTDKDGEFVFGPLCPDKKYEINFWADRVKHVKICAKCDHEGECLAGKNEKCDCYLKENRSEAEDSDYCSEE